ncbi:GSU3473 family protein [Malonomonas rubra]|uniref:GSU3473 family protein n=1 Tax=Malonomonas rubra TaxID=57040 RepID=UPI0026EEBDAE|nr:hypothetical protein [Malonomonas rubra]
MKISQVKVIYLDGSTGVVSNDALDVLIATGKIKSFKRTEGWVNIVRDCAKLRDYRNAKDYPGPDRRAP